MYVKQDYHNNHHHNNHHHSSNHHHNSGNHSHSSHSNHNHSSHHYSSYDYDDRYSDDERHHGHSATQQSENDSSDDEDNTCPLCCEEFDLFDRGFKPCPCGYQICQFCYKNIRENPELNGKCPACRRGYDEKLAEYQTITPEEWKQYQIKKDAKEKRRKQREREQRKEVMVSSNGVVGALNGSGHNNSGSSINGNASGGISSVGANGVGGSTLSSIGSSNAAAAAAALNGIFGGLGMGKDGSGSYRKHLAGVRVIQKNLVYVIGYQSNSSIEELEKMLSSEDYFGRYGKIKKIVINKRFNNGPIGSGSGGGSTSSAPSLGIYVTYVRKEDAAKCIAAVDGSINDDGKYLRAAYGTTKYCSSYLKGQTCPNPNCMFLHEPGEEADGFYHGKSSETSNLHAAAGNQVQAVVGALNGKISRELSPMLLHAKLNGGNFGVGSLLSGSPVNSSSLQSSHNLVCQTPHEAEDHGVSALPATASWGSGLNKASPRVGGAKLNLATPPTSSASLVSTREGVSVPGTSTSLSPATSISTVPAMSTPASSTSALVSTPVLTKKEEPAIIVPKRAAPLAPMTSRLIDSILTGMEERFGERRSKKNNHKPRLVPEYTGVKFDQALFNTEELREIEGLPTFFTVFDHGELSDQVDSAFISADTNNNADADNDFYYYRLPNDMTAFSDKIEKRAMDFSVRSAAVFTLMEFEHGDGGHDEMSSVGDVGIVNLERAVPVSPPPGLNSEYISSPSNNYNGGSGSNSQELLARLMNGGRSR
ncbi:hypothetical protein NADFUDRAFT_82713 [Nadsonia fulvescens var. elongata DSM 6958]|uniref:RING-type domain-containing protein n=1 Tax=Nadsonia fulvescens var. elongata DSM 6958 TaxID=857566 RepID=A0A1E3PJZ4_9ASCO|nr:hypothetical protein NADFUDRAFT_82713 [Nadsonia fulvescens var. elongata DSM 6958]